MVILTEILYSTAGIIETLNLPEGKFQQNNITEFLL